MFISLIDLESTSEHTDFRFRRNFVGIKPCSQTREVKSHCQAKQGHLYKS